MKFAESGDATILGRAQLSAERHCLTPRKRRRCSLPRTMPVRWHWICA
jgi:hypothetical protein